MTKPKPASRSKPNAKPGAKARHVHLGDLRGVAALAAEATIGVARIVEGVHKSVLDTVRLKVPKANDPTPTGGVTGLVYQSIYGVTRATGRGVEAALRTLDPLLQDAASPGPGSAQRQAFLAALNGVMGDRLAAMHNPLATRMSLRHRGEALNCVPGLQVAGATGKIVILIHGLCMHDGQWRQASSGAGGARAAAGAGGGKAHEATSEASGDTAADDHAEHIDHGAALASALGYTPIYVRYNTGRHVSENGRELAQHIEQLVAHWPVPIDELSIVVHSMGGLVARSACHYGAQDGLQWPSQLKRMVFLGTPHHGSPLERAGNWIDTILGSTAYSAPFARLGQLRSAGITDLRYGHVLDEDWHGKDRFARGADARVAVPLPAGVACYTIAACTARQRSALAERLVGDGLVPLDSALGKHPDPQRCLDFPRSAQWIAYGTNHMALLSSPQVTRQILAWMAAPVSP